MELDATRKRPWVNISREEFQRRMREQRCLKCAQPGYLAKNCTKKAGPKPFNEKTTSWQPTKRPTPWQSKPNFIEIDVEEEPEHLGND